MAMTLEAKRALSSTIRALRSRLLDERQVERGLVAADLPQGAADRENLHHAGKSRTRDMRASRRLPA